MNRICEWLADRLSRGLEPGERDAVLGDIVESGESGVEALRDLLDLALRRHVAVWREARAWVAMGGLIAPVAMYVQGWRVPGSWLDWVFWQFFTILKQGVFEESAMSHADDILRLVCGILLIVFWAGMAGFMLGSVLRSKVWAYAILSCGLWLGVWAGVPVLLISHGLLRETLFWLGVQAVLILTPFWCGALSGARLGAPSVPGMLLLATGIAMLTLIMQVEDSRATLALELWSSGQSLGRQLVWAPQRMPFLAILWQLGLLTLTERMTTREKTI